MEARLRNPRRAHARRSWTDVRRCVENGVFPVSETLCAKSGWRKPTVANQHNCTGVTRAHGNLRPAAPGAWRDDRVRICTESCRPRGSRTTAG